MMTAETPIRIRYCETDRMGIVHHSNYPKYLEMGRTDYLRLLGKPYDQLEADGIFFPLTGMEMKFLSSVTYEDEIVVHTRMKSASIVQFTLQYTITCGERTVLTGTTSHAVTTPELRPINLKRTNSVLYALLQGELEEPQPP